MTSNVSPLVFHPPVKQCNLAKPFSRAIGVSFNHKRYRSAGENGEDGFDFEKSEAIFATSASLGALNRGFGRSLRSNCNASDTADTPRRDNCTINVGHYETRLGLSCCQAL